MEKEKQETPPINLSHEDLIEMYRKNYVAGSGQSGALIGLLTDMLGELSHKDYKAFVIRMKPDLEIAFNSLIMGLSGIGGLLLQDHERAEPDPRGNLPVREKLNVSREDEVRLGFLIKEITGLIFALRELEISVDAPYEEILHRVCNHLEHSDGNL